MELQGIDYGRVHMASGVGGFKCDGTEYWLHKLFKPDFSQVTNTAKTVTLHERNTKSGANMDIDENLRPTEKFPRCIAWNPILCCAVNAVGLTNMGLRKHLDMGIWQKWNEPFFLSLMATASTERERMKEWSSMFRILDEYKSDFATTFALQENLSCPNAGVDPKGLISETEQVLDLGAEYGYIQVPKFNVQHLSVEAGVRIAAHPHCDALLISNTLPWNDLPLLWRLYSFGTPFSPLRWRGIKAPGGYSGPLLLHLVEHKVRALRNEGVTKPIIACGGITKAKHVDRLRDAGADAVEFATIANMRPWRVGEIAKRANSISWRNGWKL